MMKMYRYLLVLAIAILMILGLNISNQGINSLTMEYRKPVMGLQTQGDNISVFTMGQTHNYSKQEIIKDIILVGEKIKIYTYAALDYLLRIIRIMRILLFT
jgi:hypothetical protein